MVDRARGDERTGGAVQERVRAETKEPSLYGVVLLNDDYTPMDFVVEVLETLFQKSPAEAYRIMMQVHREGRGLAGIYPWEVAETKVDALVTRARDAGHPLQAVIEDA
ncbi:MAG TPA: ATP-dependent Clp protease adapter ClpS [Vicinamibacterales bacterium]|nr:ATP-dependent Clp protease adapter ClpS [Vicinamibacterales bacterium]